MIVGAEARETHRRFFDSILPVLGQEDHQGSAAGALYVIRERQTPGTNIASNDFFQILFVVRSFIASEGADPGRIFVEGGNRKPKVGQAGRDHRGQIAGSIYRVMHNSSWSLGSRSRASGGRVLFVLCGVS